MPDTVIDPRPGSAAERRRWTGPRLVALAVCLAAWWSSAWAQPTIAPLPEDDDQDMELSEFCIRSPEISCTNPSCHLQPPTSADRKPPAVVLSRQCIKEPSRTCTDRSCHGEPKGGRNIAHPLYLEQRCRRCHVDPRSLLAPIVSRWPDLVCLNCHIDVGLTLTSQGRHHPPGGRHCSTCHEPHESRIRNLLRSEEFLLECARCHEAHLAQARTRRYRHLHFEDRVECGFCHYAHRRGLGKFVRENTMESCLTCHDLAIQRPGRMLENIKKRLFEAPYTHGAIRTGTCPTCHTPHGSDQPALLKSGYPAGAHRVYSAEQYALCLQCHQSALVLSPEGEGVTLFRDGPKNLHHLHITQIGEGRACHVCHEPHASQRPHLLREKIRFHLWNAPLEWEELEAGGRCLTPCHRGKEYQHDKTDPDAPAPVEGTTLHRR